MKIEVCLPNANGNLLPPLLPSLSFLCVSARGLISALSVSFCRFDVVVVVSASCLFVCAISIELDGIFWAKGNCLHSFGYSSKEIDVWLEGIRERNIKAFAKKIQLCQNFIFGVHKKNRENHEK
jgi:hypothetical protein